MEAENNRGNEVEELLKTRSRNLDKFIEWFLASGLSPLDYELIEERRSDGVTLWYFRKRKES